MIADRIRDRISNFDGSMGICYIDLGTGNSCSAGNCDVFPASGIVKLMLLVETFRRIEDGTLHKNDRHILKREDRIEAVETGEHPSYGALAHLHNGIELTIEDLYKLSVTVSDNMAFNILLKKLSLKEVNHTMERMGFSKSRIRRAILDINSINQGIENEVSVREMANLLYRMYKGQVVSEKASKEMLDIMKRHQKTSVLPYHFEERLPVAHVTGYDDTLLLDVGIVYGPAPFVLAMASEASDIKNAESIMRDITLMCYKNSIELNK